MDRLEAYRARVIFRLQGLMLLDRNKVCLKQRSDLPLSPLCPMHVRCKRHTYAHRARIEFEFATVLALMMHLESVCQPPRGLNFGHRIPLRILAAYIAFHGANIDVFRCFVTAAMLIVRRRGRVWGCRDAKAVPYTMRSSAAKWTLDSLVNRTPRTHLAISRSSPSNPFLLISLQPIPNQSIRYLPRKR